MNLLLFLFPLFEISTTWLMMHYHNMFLFIPVALFQIPIALYLRKYSRVSYLLGLYTSISFAVLYTVPLILKVLSPQTFWETLGAIIFVCVLLGFAWVLMMVAWAFCFIFTRKKKFVILGLLYLAVFFVIGIMVHFGIWQDNAWNFFYFYIGLCIAKAICLITEPEKLF